MKKFSKVIVRALASKKFFYALMAFFVFEALWYAASAAYPMAFDEEYHFGVIRLFSEHALPFLDKQPESADSFGAIIRDPSFLYHYLMSFPYRLLSIITDNQTAIIMVLRLLNIALFAASLVLFRRVLLRAGTSAAFTHTALAIFVLIPIVPQMAAHISYDNLLMLLVAWMCLLVAQIVEAAQHRQLRLAPLAGLLLVCMAASIVKYESLPIIAAALLFTGVLVWRTFRGAVWRRIAQSWRQASARLKFILLAVFVLLFGCMIQKYGVNVWTYHALKPSCDTVLDAERCESFGPWARNHRMAESKGDVNANPAAYTWEWLQGLHLRLFFVISGVENRYANYSPLPSPALGAVVLAVGSLAVLLAFNRRIFAQRSLLVFFLVVSALYISALWFENYSQFLETGQPVAINGRYLLPILLLLAAIFGRGLSLALRRVPSAKAVLAAAAIFCFLYGGGIFSFILRSDTSWYWQNSTVIEMNKTARHILAPVIIEGDGRY